jgi:hypothetical protein
MCDGGGGPERNKNTVKVEEKSFNATGNTSPIDRKDKFFRSKSKTEQFLSKNFASFVGSSLGGAIGGLPGSLLGGRLAKKAAGRKVSETDSEGRDLSGRGGSGGGEKNNSKNTTARREKANLAKKPIIPATAAAAATGRSSNVLAGKDVAEKKLKTLLGQ